MPSGRQEDVASPGPALSGWPSPLQGRRERHAALQSRLPTPSRARQSSGPQPVVKLDHCSDYLSSPGPLAA
eukprot:3345059-Alexandrium_andersonii.AAC.1